MQSKHPPAFEDETERVLSALEDLMTSSGLSQRRVETRAGFSKGYLSRLLSRKLALKFAHITAILAALEIDSRAFFADLYPPRRLPALEQFDEESRLEIIERRVGEIYASRIGTLEKLERKIERCEDAIQRLERMGLLGDRRKQRSQGRLAE